MDIHILVFFVLNEEITNFRQCKYEQIGDAIPPLLAYAVAKQIVAALNGEMKNE